MTQSRISYNVHSQGGIDNARFMAHLDKLNPAALVILDGLGLAQQVKARFPDCTVIHRNYGITKGDDDIHKRVSPQQWIDLRGKEADSGIYLYTTNEPAFDQQAIDWHCELMRLAAPRGIHLAAGNWSVGNPGPDDWRRARPMIDLLNTYRALFVLALHEYACGVITSGLEGGYPDNAGVQIGQPGGRNYIMPDKWPADTSTLTLWHCGRWRFLQNYCRNEGIYTPRIILTEHGMDDVSDIKAWAETLQKTPPYEDIRGWKTLQKQWETWYSALGWSPERAYAEMLLWADRAIYAGSPVEAQCVYSWGHSSNDWIPFDVSGALEFQELLEASVKTVTRPAPVSKPDHAGIGTKVKITFSAPLRNLRDGPGTEWKDIGDLKNGDEFAIYYDTLRGAKDNQWVWVETDHGNGWIATNGVSFSNVVTKPIPPLPTPEPPVDSDDTQPRPIQTGKIVISYAMPQEALVIIRQYLEATGKTARLLNGQFKMEEM